MFDLVHPLEDEATDGGEARFGACEAGDLVPEGRIVDQAFGGEGDLEVEQGVDPSGVQGLEVGAPQRTCGADLLLGLGRRSRRTTSTRPITDSPTGS